MPGLNGTGPTSKGPLTGRGLGSCSNEELQGNPGVGHRGCGRRRFSGNKRQGRGRGVWKIGSSNDEIERTKKKN